MKRIKNYLSRLNWHGFCFVMVLMMLGGLANESCTSFTYWLILMGCVGFPLSLFPLFVGMKPKNKSNKT